jgi:predicted nucleotidyltransferase
MHPAIANHLAGISEICQRYGIRHLEVFGSGARAQDFESAQSDADFLVEFSSDSPTDLRRYYGAKTELEHLLGRPVDLIEAGAIRNPFVLAEINRHKQSVYVA